MVEGSVKETSPYLVDLIFPEKEMSRDQDKNEKLPITLLVFLGPNIPNPTYFPFTQ